MDLSALMGKVSGKYWGVPSQYLKTWYLAVIERMVLYAAPVWGFNLQTRARRNLSALQRTFLLRIAKANRHTSTVALQQLAGVVPLELSLEREALCGRLFRLGMKVYVDERECLPDSVQKIGNRWFMPPWKFNIIDRFIYNGQPIPRDCRVYFTDGSKIAGSVGSAFCAFHGDQMIYTWRVTLDSHNSIFQAEIIAIYEALKWHLLNSPGENFLILTDSFSTVVALRSNRQRNILLQKLIKKYYEFNGHFGALA